MPISATILGMKKTVFRYNLDTLTAEEIKFLRSKIHVTTREEISDKIVDNGMVDIFDFKTYKAEHELMKKYYKDLTLILKTALLIDYKYNHLPDDGDAFTKTFNSKKTAKEKMAYIELSFDVFEPLYILHHFYRHYAPDKTEEEIDEIYEKYESISLTTMFNCAYRKYVDSGWKNDKLWFE